MPITPHPQILLVAAAQCHAERLAQAARDQVSRPGPGDARPGQLLGRHLPTVGAGSGLLALLPTAVHAD